MEEGAAVEEAGPTTDAAAEEVARRTQRERGGREGGRQAALARRPPTDRPIDTPAAGERNMHMHTFRCKSWKCAVVAWVLGCVRGRRAKVCKKSSKFFALKHYCS